ncbi:hypothetical protein RFI_30028, partial [Reticulomyxa filosa]
LKKKKKKKKKKKNSINVYARNLYAYVCAIVASEIKVVLENAWLCEQSESVPNKNDQERSPPATPREELSHSDSRFDEDTNPGTPHQMGRFFVEKVNKLELANDVKSHNDKITHVPLISAATHARPTINRDDSSDHTANHAIFDHNLINAPTTAVTASPTSPAIAIVNTDHSNTRDDDDTNATANNATHQTNGIVTQPDVDSSAQMLYDESNAQSSSRSNSSVKSVTTFPKITQWTKQDCIRWIVSLGDAYVDYAANFEKNGMVCFPRYSHFKLHTSYS